MGDLLGPRADAPEVPGIADRDDTQARLSRLGDREIHRLTGNDLAVPELSVDDRMSRGFAHDDRMPVGEHHPFRVPFDVLRHTNDAVRVMAGKIGVDQMITDNTRFRVRRSRRTEHRRGERAQVRGGNPVRRRSVAHRPECGIRESGGRSAQFT